MDQKDWQILNAIAEEKSLTKAAEKLFITQPALSYRLKQLEESFQTKLFFRTKKGIEFTSEGEFLVDYAKDRIKEYLTLKDEIFNIGNEVRGTLRIGVSSNFAQYKLPALLKKFSTSYPNIQFKVQTGWSTEIMNLLNQSQIHLGILRGDYDWEGEKLLLTKEQLYIISKNEISLEELPQLPFIYYKTDNSLKRLISRWWNDHFSQSPLTAMEVDRQETSKEMVKNDLGFSVVPEICLTPSDDLYTEGLTYKNGEPVLRDTWLMYRTDFIQLNIVKAFIDFLIKQQTVKI
ncbi:putative HTH-type transcriptional regulator YraN [Halobacillus andaensis]|uniref:HTH-type transcriptional regulator YraN n=1 Tax=Halobacillus andaensis TaxID=1176239 RepID=A0A917B6T2_HALAA|nr:LysR family transcriptional regulator [Halobacillus andaensis]MBP2006537.1 DNA-binding transcriptional LysR family regulator [Halobacillus andaensis]GGF28133.1 putative HTH-type transcriptional regulator YraN [Halobacillus andaensis]